MNTDLSGARAASSMRLPGFLREALCADSRRVVVVGARGWIGRSVVELTAEALGEATGERLFCFGSTRQRITLSDGRRLDQFPLEHLGRLDRRPTLLFHLAFLTMDKVPAMSPDAYRAANRRISDLVGEALDPIGVDRLFLASSGAAAFADDPTAPTDRWLYGGLKRDDEDRFAAWAACRDRQCRAAICRIYSVSGPFINKPETYALADLILRALRGEAVEVFSTHAVWRSYAAVREVVAVALAVLLAEDGDAVQRFDSGGEAMELGDVARLVAATLGVAVRVREPDERQPDYYCGDHPAWLALLQHHGIEHLDPACQIRETADYLAALDGQSITCEGAESCKG